MERRPIGDAELEAMLRDAALHLAYPPTRDLLPAVRARIEGGAGEGFWQLLWSPRLALVPALATLAMLLAVALAFQPVAATAAEALGLRGIGIFRGPAPTATVPSPTATPSATPSASPGGSFGDAHRVASVGDASREAGFDVLVPSALGAPDEVYVSSSDRVVKVFLVYGPRSGIAPASATGVSLVVMEARGSYDERFLGKFLGPSSRAEPLAVSGGKGVWIEGAPHQFFFVAPGGDIVPDTIRLAGNVLVWERSGLLLRIEADVTKDEALGIAASMR